MRFVLEVSDPTVMEYVMRQANRSGEDWEASVKALILAGGERLFRDQDLTEKRGEKSKRVR